MTGTEESSSKMLSHHDKITPGQTWSQVMDTQAVELLRTEIRRALSDASNEPIDDIPIAELGLDSLSFFEVLMNLSDHGINFPVAKLDNHMTIRSLLDTLN
jgi:acyl carrier protein